jgi:hypothetical protein
MLRHEQRTAVLVGDERRLERPGRLRVLHDLELVHADERAQHRESAARSMVLRFTKVCDATWPRLSPVTSAAAPSSRARRVAMRIIMRRYSTTRRLRGTLRTISL